MTGTIYAPNDKNYLILNEEIDIPIMIGEVFGRELETRINKLYNKEKKRKEEMQFRLNSDLEYYEDRLESNVTAFTDILEIVKEIEVHLEGKRINRDKLYYNVTEIIKIINNQI